MGGTIDFDRGILMSEQKDETPIFNYVASIQGREFIVTIFENKMSQWDDLSGYGFGRPGARRTGGRVRHFSARG
jgi:hypothetical protein